MLNIDGTKVGEISGKRGLCLLNITNRKAVIKHVLRLLGLKKKEAGRAYCFIRTKTNLKNNHAGFI
jgi:hypothetical protein